MCGVRLMAHHFPCVLLFCFGTYVMFNVVAFLCVCDHAPSHMSDHASL
jgi:hypothetical protein